MTVTMLPSAGEYAHHKGERFETDGVVYNVGGTECYLLKGYGLFAIDMLEVVDELKYRKKPVTIEAYQTDVELDIPTLEGTMHASVGDYIITGVRGERYPCKPDIFLETYEPAQGDVDATVGAGTCRNEWPDHFAFRCSECGASWYGVGVDVRPYPRFCPNCGCEVARNEQ